jgi:hypothetical protein
VYETTSGRNAGSLLPSMSLMMRSAWMGASLSADEVIALIAVVKLVWDEHSEQRICNGRKLNNCPMEVKT